MTTLILLGVIQGLVVSLVLWSRDSTNKDANRILAVFIGCLSLVNFEDYLVASKQIFAVPHLYSVFSPLVFTLGPLFYLYIKQVSARGTGFKWDTLLHLIPWLLITLLLALTFYFESGELKKQQISTDIAEANDDLFTYIMALQSAVYVFLSIRLIIKHNKEIKNNFSFTEGITLKTPLTLLVILVAMWLFWAIGRLFFSQQANNTDDIIFTLFVYVFGYAGFVPRRNNALVNMPLDDQTVKSNIRSTSKSLSDQESQYIYNALLQYMETDKPYLKQELGIQDLADGMNMGVNQLSYIINNIGRQNFFDFINSYRIEEFKKRLSDPRNKHFTLLAIAFDCGFSSKAAFNSLFKKKTGVTPSQYKASLMPGPDIESSGLET